MGGCVVTTTTNPTGTQVVTWAATADLPTHLSSGMPVVVHETIGDEPATLDAVEATLAALAGERGLAANSVRTARTYVLALRRRWQDCHLDDGTETETHRLRIRPGVVVAVTAPVDLTTVEAERVGAWVALMGVDP